MRTIGYYLDTRADCEGDWTVGDPTAVVYPTAKAALAAWADAYRGPDEYGNRAYARVEEVTLEGDPEWRGTWRYGRWLPLLENV